MEGDDTPQPSIEKSAEDNNVAKENENPTRKGFRWTWKTIGTVGGVGVNGAAIVKTAVDGITSSNRVGGIFVLVSGGITAGITGPAAVISEHYLTRDDNLRGQINKIRNEVNRLSEENDKLSGLIDDLAEEVDRLKDIEEALSSLVEAQGESLEQLMVLVKENKRINRKMKKILNGLALQDVLNIIMESDKNGDFSFDDQEIEALMLRLRNVEALGFNDKVDEVEFREKIQQGKSVSAIISVVKELLPDPDEDSDDEDSEYSNYE